MPCGTGSVRRVPLAALKHEVHQRTPVYAHDWTVALRHPSKVLASALYMFFISVFPALTFGNSLASTTHRQYGIVETLLTTAVCGSIFATLGGQPLVILGVTGPVTVFSATVYGLTRTFGLPFLPFMFWVCAWSAAMHVALAVWNWCDDVVKWVTRFSCEVFGLMIAAIYLYDGARGLARMYDGSSPRALSSFFLSSLVTLCVPLLALRLNGARTWWAFTPHIRSCIADYALSVSVILIWVLATAAPPWYDVPLAPLPVPLAFGPSTPRPWLVPFWDVHPGAIVAAIVPGFILTALFLFDHNVSSLLAQRPELQLQKPSAFNYDFLVVGACLLLCGVLGLPVANGLIPQSDLHVISLLHTKVLRRHVRKGNWWAAEVHELPLDGSYHAAVILAPKGGTLSFYAVDEPQGSQPQQLAQRPGTPPLTPHRSAPPSTTPPPTHHQPTTPPQTPNPLPSTPPYTPTPPPSSTPINSTTNLPTPSNTQTSTTSTNTPIPLRTLLPKSQAALEALFPPQYWAHQYVATHGSVRAEEEERFVVETRVSGLLQSLGIGLMLIPPSLRLLHGMPPSLLFGTFVYMGVASFAGNQFWARLAALTVTQPTYRFRRYASAALSPLILTLPASSVVLFTTLQFLSFVAVTVITIAGGPAAISFPLLILLLIPLRHCLFPKLFPPAHLAILDSWSPPHLPTTADITLPPCASPTAPTTPPRKDPYLSPLQSDSPSTPANPQARSGTDTPA